MTRQTTLLSYNENADNKPFKFVIIADGGGLFPIIKQLKFAPDGWKDEITITRNSKYKGVFRSYSSNELKFPKDGRDHLKNIYEAKGIALLAVLYVYKWDNENFEYVNHFQGKIDFSTYKIDELFVAVQVVDNSFAESVKNRENVDVDLLTTKTINGSTMPDFAPATKRLWFPDLTILAQSNWSSGNYSIIDNELLTLDYQHLQLVLGFSELDEAEDQTKGHGVDYFYRNAPADAPVKGTLSISGNFTWNYGAVGAISFGFVMRGATSGNVIIKQFLNKAPNLGPDIYTFEVVAETTGWVDVTTADNLSLEMFVRFADMAPPNAGYTLIITETDWKLEVELSEIVGQMVLSFPFYEALLRTSQKLTNQYDSFHSDFFGRTDSEITTYPSDGQLGNLTKGALIRALNNTIDVNFSVTLEDLFESLSSVFNLGLGIETIGGLKKVRVENLSYFFDSTVALDLSARISTEEIGKEVLPDWHYSQIKTGYKKFEYEIKNAIFEYNSKQTYATKIDSLSSVNNTLDIVSKYRADTNGIIVLREEYGTDNSEDVDGDDDVFMVDAVRGISFMQARTDEDFDLITGNIDSDQYYNYDFTPKRNMLRHGMNIRAGLERDLNTYLTFQTTDKSVDLTTQLSTEVNPVVEGSDERINDLNEPMWWAEAYIIECPFYLEDLQAVEANPYGIIKIADDKYGWILEIKTGNDDKAKLRLLRVNTNYVTPI